MNKNLTLFKRVVTIVQQVFMYFSSWNEYQLGKTNIDHEGYFMVKLRDGTVVRDCYLGSQRNKILHDGLLKKGSGSPLVIVKKNIASWKIQESR